MDSSGASSDELELTLGSTGVASVVDADSSFEVSFEGIPPGLSPDQPKSHSPFALRSQCANSQCCPHGTGIHFKSRISPSPARKTRLRSRRRRRSDQSRLDATDSTGTTLGSTFLDVSNVDTSHLTNLDEAHYQPEPQQVTVSLGHTLHHARDDEAFRRSLTPKKKKKEVRYEDQEYTSLTSNITNITSLSHSQEISQVDFRMNENPEFGNEINSAFIAPPDPFDIVASTPTKKFIEPKPPAATDSSESGFEEGVPVKNKTTSTSESFIPGSQFFAHFRTPQKPTYSSTSDYFTDFTGTDTPSKLKESTRRLSIRKPFNPYIAYSSDEELEDWMKNPKTDYTYSASLTYRKRVTPERKVGSPNMSRKGLRGNIDYNQSSDFSDHSFSIDAKNYGKTYQNYRSSGLPMDALSDSESESPPVATRTRNSRSTSITRPNSNGSIITTVTKSNYTTTKKTYLQGGLDEQSGEESQDEIVPLPSLRFRTGTPLTASRGGTPLVASKGGTPLARRSCTPLFTSHKNETNTRHTNTLISTPEEEEEKTLYRKIGSIPSAACRTVVLSSKWVFSYIVTSVILMATKTTSYLSSSKSSSNASSDKLTSIADSNSSHISSSTKSESGFDKFMTTITTVITTITTTTTMEEITETTSGSLESVTTKVKRRPRLLFWIPLLLLLLLLAYWWLFLAPATSEDEGETQSLGYLVTIPFIKLYNMCSWLALNAYDGLLFAVTKIYDLSLWLIFGTYNRIAWLVSSSPEALITASSNTFNTLTSVLATSFNSTSKSVIALRDNAYIYSAETTTGVFLGTQNIFNYLWLSSISIINWFWLSTQSALNYLWLNSISIMNGCWSFILTCLTYLLDLLYYLYGTLQGVGLYLYGVLLSSASIFSTSPLPLKSSNDTLTEAPGTIDSGYENDGTSWLSFAELTHSTSQIIIGTSRGLSEAALSSHNWIWTSWVGIMGSVGETLSDASGYTISTVKSVSSNSIGFLDTFWEFASLGFLSMWSLLVYLWTGLWSGLLYLLTSLWTFLTSFAFTLGEFASGTAAALTSTIGTISLPIIGYFNRPSVKEVPPPIIPPSDPTIASPQIGLDSMVEEIVDKVLGSSRLQNNLQQLIDIHSKEEDVSARMRSVIEQEVNLVRAESTVMKEEVASIKSDSAQILGLKEQQTTLINQLNMLAAAVENTSETKDKQQQFNDQLNGLRDQINLLSQELQNLQVSHTNLESEVSTCCKRASLTLDDVERHVTTLLGDILGFSGGNNTTGDFGEIPPMATASDLNAWLKSYFVAKHELEARLTALADSMEKATPVNVDLPKETMEQTTQMVMETVMDKIRDEIRIQQDHYSSQTKDSLSEQVKVQVQDQLEENLKVQVEAATGKLKEQMVLDVQEQVKISTEEIGSSLNAEVNSLVAESVSRELSAAVPLAVSSAIPDAIANQVNGIVEEVVATQVEGVVEKVVASQVNGVVEKVVATQVDGIIENVVTSQVDGVLEKVVTSKVDGVVEKIVTSQVDGVVERAVNSQVNGAVENAVSSQVSGVIEKVVTSQVDGAVEYAITNQVNGVVEKIVANQVDGAVEKAVTSQMSGVVEKIVGETVESSVKTLISQEISSALSDSVNDAVEDAISSNLPDAVAKTLPGMVNDAVTSTINNTMIKQIQEKMNEETKGPIYADVIPKGGNSSTTIGVITASGLDEKGVQRIVKEALNMYDADKTGMVDHALESAGGNIISTRCTEGYQVHMAEVSILGWPIYRYSINNPRTIIQPDVMPGQCWAFKGSQGYIVIQLAGPVRPTGFTMEHIPKTLSPSGSIDSAPREFSVWGLISENGEEIELGSYEFVHDGESLQYFSVKDGVIPNDMYFPIVELKIKSNHGNMKYTCLYRFRVHGVRYF